MTPLPGLHPDKLRRGPAEFATSPKTAPAARAAIDALWRAGAGSLFTVPGGSVASLLHEALQHPHLQTVVTKSENGATFAAAGYARATGRPAAAMVTSGPGVLNGLMGLASAHTDGIPLVLLVGEVARAHHGHGAIQDGSSAGLRIDAVLRPLCKRVVVVSNADALTAAVVDALEHAMATPRGPVAILVPRDLASKPVTAAVTVVPQRVQPRLECDLSGLAARCQEAERILLLAGSGCRWGSAPARLALLSERLGAPVATTPAAKGVFPESHPRSLGAWGMGGDGRASAHIRAGLDVLVVLGSGLGDLASDGFSDVLHAPTFVQVDARLSRIGRHYAVTHAFGVPAAVFLDALLVALGDGPPGIAPRAPVSPACEADEASSESRPLTCADALRTAQRLQQPGTRWLIDSGQHYFHAVEHLRVDAPERFVAMTGLGAMGSSLGAAIGTSCAQPAAPVHVVCGDGAFAMMGSEISTASRLGLAPTVLVMNDGALGMVQLGMQSAFGTDAAFPTGPLDVVAVAQGFGAHASRVSSIDELTQALRSSPGDRPHVIDLQIAPYESPQPNARTRALVSEFQS